MSTNENRAISHLDRSRRADEHDRGRRQGIAEPQAPGGFNRAIQNSRMTVSSFVESKFVPEHVQHKALAGQTHYRAILKHVLRPETVNRILSPEKAAQARMQSVSDWPYLDDVPLCDIRAEHVRRLVAAAFAREYSWQTAKHIKNVVFAILSHAQREGCFYGPNPATQVKLPPKVRKESLYLTIEQTRTVLELLKSPEREVALFIVSTGMNIQEICNLRWMHVNLLQTPRFYDEEVLPPCSIAVRAKWNTGGLGDAKQGRNRNISIPGPLFSLLADWALSKGVPDPEQFVLLSDTGQPVSPAELRTGRLAPIRRKLGIPWLSWRVLSRAHHALLTEFRPQLESLIASTVPEGPHPVRTAEAGSDSPGDNKSGTITNKFSCRTFPRR